MNIQENKKSYLVKHLHVKIHLIHLPGMYKNARIDSQCYNFISLVVLYDKSNFECEEQESFEDVLYI